MWRSDPLKNKIDGTKNKDAKATDEEGRNKDAFKKSSEVTLLQDLMKDQIIAHARMHGRSGRFGKLHIL